MRAQVRVGLCLEAATRLVTLERQCVHCHDSMIVLIQRLPWFDDCLDSTTALIQRLP